MSAIEQLESLDRVMAETKRRFEDEKQEIRNECMVAKIENELLKAQLATATANEKRWQRIATQFVLQFDMVEKICSDVKLAATSVREQQDAEEYVADQDAGNANAMASDDTGNIDDAPITENGRDANGICTECGAAPGYEHRPDCNQGPLPEFLNGETPQDNLTDPPANAKLDPDFTQPSEYVPGKASARLLKRPRPLSET